ncbi:unnamed protein product [Dibothriocephalus latus]|uniref:SCP domain-containing protein n=1 Tax=Dibothriocephalus latus TaxID=60516 RepID=A0A3P6USC3_DIBLA|nr:unnamed protein product [Dibothriocephalus latus]
MSDVGADWPLRTMLVCASRPIGAQTYSDEMEKLAASWVANCKFDHPDPNVDTQYAGTGQNLALFGTMPADVYSSAASMWNQEKKNYDYATDTCTGSCGHYKQRKYGWDEALCERQELQSVCFDRLLRGQSMFQDQGPQLEKPRTQQFAQLEVPMDNHFIQHPHVCLPPELTFGHFDYVF